jgi:hypothetical protein
VRVRFHVTIGAKYYHGCYYAPYFWRIDDVALVTNAARWLTPAALSGEVAPSETQSLALAFDADSLPCGDYTETLRITTNDPAHPSFDEPVILRVSDATPALAASLLSSSAEPGAVRLAWAAPAAGALAVERRTDASGWQPAGAPERDGAGAATFVDTVVEPGGRYAYRLVQTLGGATAYTAETWVDVPWPRVLALEGARPNPAVRDVSVAFSLPDGAPARLALVDVAGRVVASRDVGALGPGPHVVPLGDAARLRAGVYLLRLMHGGRTLVRKCAITP